MERYYVTTPIYYVNGPPHLGHSYTTIVADALARFARLEGKEAYFLTGTDEHGDKNYRIATEKGISPREWVDAISAQFRALWPTLHIEHSDFIRTTEERHRAVVRAILQRVYDSGDIYRATYGGKYCFGCERFLDDDELLDGKCPDHGVEPSFIEEENYFFRMGKYLDWLRGHIGEHPDLIRPDRYRNEALATIGALLKKPEAARDLSISRPKSRLPWGIPLPFDEAHVTYVWFDALINYVSALGWPDGEKFERYWPVAQHITAKDILKPHGIYWPCMLRAAGIPIYRHLNVHGFWRGADGRKMSKSLGNVVDPVEMRDIYGADVFRYVLLREMPWGLDANISDSIIAERDTSDLANDLGNLVSRAMRLVFRSFDGKVPTPGAATGDDSALGSRWLGALPQVRSAWHELRTSQAVETVMECVRATNRYFDANRPWELAKEGKAERLATVLYNSLEALRIVSVLFWPIMPERMAKLREQLGIATPPNLEKAGQWGVLPPGQQLIEGEGLFPRADVKAAKAREHAKMEAASQQAPANEPKAEPGRVTLDEFRRIRLKVGTILAAEPIPKATKLLKLTVDLGEDRPRQLVAGVAEHYAPEQIVGRQIVVVANLEPAMIRGIESQGMLLASEDGSRLSLLTPDTDVQPGADVR